MTMRALALAIACVAWAWLAAAPAARADEAQPFVQCTGWHALCTASHDCTIHGGTADCDCLRVNETHIVYTSEIQDPAARAATLAKCTKDHPCVLDEAPICRTIREGAYTVDGIRYPWVSTYSYRGWCSLVAADLKACDPSSPGYQGDRHWAICDAAPCTERADPSDPNRPLSCRCRVEDTPFVGANGSCSGDKGGIMSSFALPLWDFDTNTYRIWMLGYDYVGPACAPLRSDPPPEGGKGK